MEALDIIELQTFSWDEVERIVNGNLVRDTKYFCESLPTCTTVGLTNLAFLQRKKCPHSPYGGINSI